LLLPWCLLQLLLLLLPCRLPCQLLRRQSLLGGLRQLCQQPLEAEQGAVDG
jgi:hypothetical protein